MLISGNLGNKLRQFFADCEAAGVSLDTAEVRELLRLCDLVAKRGGSAPVEVLADSPVYCGNVPLKLTTLGASAWIRQRLYEEGWFDEEPALFLLAKAYAYANGRQPAKLAQWTDEDALAMELERWTATMGCTLQELDDGVEACESGFPTLMRREEADSDPKLLELVSRHCETFGQTLDHWLWLQPAQRIAWMGYERMDETDPKRLTPGDHANQRLTKLITKLREKYHEKLSPPAPLPGPVVPLPEPAVGAAADPLSPAPAAP